MISMICAMRWCTADSVGASMSKSSSTRAGSYVALPTTPRAISAACSSTASLMAFMRSSSVARSIGPAMGSCNTTA